MLGEIPLPWLSVRLRRYLSEPPLRIMPPLAFRMSVALVALMVPLVQFREPVAVTVPEPVRVPFEISRVLSAEVLFRVVVPPAMFRVPNKLSAEATVTVL